MSSRVGSPAGGPAAPPSPASPSPSPSLPEGRLVTWRASGPSPASAAGPASAAPASAAAVARLLAAAYADFAPVARLWPGGGDRGGGGGGGLERRSGEDGGGGLERRSGGGGGGGAAQEREIAWLARVLVDRAVEWGGATVYMYVVDRRADPVAMAVLARRRPASALARMEAVPWFARMATGYAAAPVMLGWAAYTRWAAYADLCTAMAATDMAAYVDGYWHVDLVATDPAFRGQGITPHVLSQAIANCVSAEAGLAIYAIATQDDHVKLYQQFGFEVVSQATVPGSGSGGVGSSDASAIDCWGMVRHPPPTANLPRRISGSV